MTLWPLTPYRPLESGEWRLSVRLIKSRRFARVVDRFPEGTVYRFWVFGMLARIMVKH